MKIRRVVAQVYRLDTRVSILENGVGSQVVILYVRNE